MRKIFLTILFSLAAIAFSGKCPIKHNTNIVYYGKTGSGGVTKLSQIWLDKFLAWWKQHDSRVNYVRLNEHDLQTNCDLTKFPNLKLYMQPGGNAYKQQKTLGPKAKENIKKYLNKGGAYFGVCAGWYYASNNYYWKGVKYNHPYLLGIYPATTEGPLRELADYPAFAMTTIGTYNMVYWGGPTRGYEKTSNKCPGKTLHIFDDWPNDMPAVVRYKKMLFCSIHPEAWENIGFKGLSTKERIQNYRWLASELNKVSQTKFKIGLGLKISV